MKPHIKELKNLDVCKEALEYAENFNSLEKAWQACERGDWLLWYAAHFADPFGSASHRKVKLAAVRCAALASKYNEDERVQRALLLVKQYGRGKRITKKQLKNAAAAAYAVAANTSAYAAAYTSVAYTSAAAHVAYAAHAAHAAAYAAYTDVRLKTLKQCADIVRSYYSKPPKKEDIND